MTWTVLFINTAARWAAARRVARINRHNRHPVHPRLVLDKRPELIEGPAVLATPLRFANRRPRAYTFEIFQGNATLRVFSLRNQSFGDVVIDPGGEPPFFATAAAQQRLCRPRTLSLQLCAQPCMAQAQPVQLGRAINITVTIGGDVDDAQVNANKVGGLRRGRFGKVDLGGKIPLAAAVDQIAFALPRLQQAMGALITNKWYMLPAAGGPDRNSSVVPGEGLSTELNLTISLMNLTFLQQIPAH